MKKCLFVLLTVFLLCKMEAQTPSYDLEIGGIQYNIISLSDMTLCAVGISYLFGSTLEIPETVEYNGRTFSVPRVDIQDSYEFVERVILPDNLEYLYMGGCNAEELNLNAKVLGGFNNCQRLKRLYISSNITKISCNSFRFCDLDKLVLEDGNSILLLEGVGGSERPPFTSSSIDTLYCGRNLFDKNNPFNYNSTATQTGVLSGCGISVVEYGPFVDAVEGSMLRNVKNLSIPNNVTFMRLFRGDSLEKISISNKDFVYYKYISGGNEYPLLDDCENIDSVYANTINSLGLYKDLSCNKFVLGPNADGMRPSTNISITGNNAYVKVYNRTPLDDYPVFTNETYLYTPLYVPRGTLNAYQTAEGWRNFFNIIEFDWDDYYYSIKALPNNSEYGSVEGSGAYHYGDIVTLTANPYFDPFICWSENGQVVCTDRIYTFMVDRDRTLIANFKYYFGNYVSISASSNNSEFGTVIGAGTYLSGEMVTLRAMPNFGCSFQNWTENGLIVCTTSTYSFVAENDRYLTANFGGTGVDENEEASKVFVYVKDNMLFVEGVDKLSEITVYNVQGQSVYKGLGRKISIPRVGVYIVAVDNRRIKVVVE